MNPKILSQLLQEARAQAWQGQIPTYIPRLAQRNPEDFAFCYLGLQGDEYLAGDLALCLPLMSVCKPLLLLYLLSHLGREQVWAKVGQEPSSYPFNCLEQLQADQGFPRNPFLNSGAIVLSSLLSSPTRVRDWLNQLAGCNLQLDSLMLESVRSLPNEKNLALAQTLQNAGYLDNISLALDNYNYLCCLAGTIKEVARLGLMLLQSQEPLLREDCQTVLEIMANCGLYEISLDFAKTVGFPSKSGVSGLILSLTTQGAIAIYSPPLNPDGNSTVGLFLLTKLALAFD